MQRDRFSFQSYWVAAYFHLLWSLRLTLHLLGRAFWPPCWGLRNLAEVEQARLASGLIVTERDCRIDVALKSLHLVCRQSSTLRLLNLMGSWSSPLVIVNNGSGADDGGGTMVSSPADLKVSR